MWISEFSYDLNDSERKHENVFVLRLRNVLSMSLYN